ncbi:protein of unknown function [Streptococcus thermophilus]|nr:protein of unknown function [Streptococcus thermophilus]CAD0158146.1 protein of unknown function [Streptococcus thermophilus]CAD0173061.1 protein of unknown function [Streptococcus thermophilus]
MAEKSSFSASFIGYSCKKGDEVKNINFFLLIVLTFTAKVLKYTQPFTILNLTCHDLS